MLGKQFFREEKIDNKEEGQCKREVRIFFSLFIVEFGDIFIFREVLNINQCIVCF